MNSNPTPGYVSWIKMRERCNNPNHNRYPYYGGRGITVCERWNSFKNFHDDMGDRPPGTSIDRINNDGNYEPGNCRWATTKQQIANTSRKLRAERRVVDQPRGARKDRPLPPGVYAGSGKWRASLMFRGDRYYLGTLDSPVLASEAYMAAKRGLREGREPPRPRGP